MNHEVIRPDAQLAVRDAMSLKLWECQGCRQMLPRPWSPCDCAAHPDRYLVTPYGTVVAPLGTGPLEAA